MAKPKDVLLEETELEQLDNNEVSAKDLGDKYGKKRGYFDNIKHQRKLKTSFKTNLADPNVQAQDGAQASPDLQHEGGLEHQIAPPIDYHMAVKGLYKGADSVFKLIAVMSRGQLIYTNVEDKKLDELADITQNDHAVQKLATMGGISTIVTVGAILGTFSGQFKIVKKIKHDKLNPSCQCEKCLKVKKSFEDFEKKEDLENVTNIENIKKEPEGKEEQGKIEKSFDKITEVLREEPTTDLNGLIIEKNTKPTLTAEQVIQQNKEKVKK